MEDEERRACRSRADGRFGLIYPHSCTGRISWACATQFILANFFAISPDVDNTSAAIRTAVAIPAAIVLDDPAGDDHAEWGTPTAGSAATR